MIGKRIYNEEISFIREVAEYVVSSGNCKINDIQVKFSLGFRRTMLILSILEEMEIVGRINQEEGRKVLVTPAGLEYKLNKTSSESTKQKNYYEYDGSYIIKKVKVIKKEPVRFVEKCSEIDIMVVIGDHNE